ncbi:MAG: type II toxin-antitoxin system PemK/MazF family toxin [Candidatus Omnitrophica bacterium]|nr:type II toxin-antitoxin system PemK/MazF family toxin [Candidatus Omnitrophota bacterium]
MERGEVWWAALPRPIGRHPVVILSRHRAVQVRDAVTVAEVTSRIRNIPVEVPLGPEDGMPKKCVVNLDVINTVPKKLLTERVTTLSNGKLQAVEDALKFALALPQ